MTNTQKSRQKGILVLLRVGRIRREHQDAMLWLCDKLGDVDNSLIACSGNGLRFNMSQLDHLAQDVRFYHWSKTYRRHDLAIPYCPSIQRRRYRLMDISDLQDYTRAMESFTERLVGTRSTVQGYYQKLLALACRTFGNTPDLTGLPRPHDAFASLTIDYRFQPVPTDEMPYARAWLEYINTGIMYPGHPDGPGVPTGGI